MINKKNLIVFLTVMGLVIMSCDDDKDDDNDDSGFHVEIVSSGPTIDGVGTDAVWDEAGELEITLGETAGYSTTDVVELSLKAIQTATDLYILAEWMDPSASENHDKSQLTYEDGAWGKSGNEDRIFFMFDMGENGTEGVDCASMCHVSAGQMYTETGKVDVWHWKAARTNPLSLADDKYFDNNIGDDGGRHGDAKTISAYKDNYSKVDDIITPLYSGPITDGSFIIIPDGGSTDDLTAYTADDTSLASIPGYYLNANAIDSGESRHNVSAVGNYSGGKWTVEFKRALDTGNDDDVVFTAGSSYQMTVATTDNSGGNHSGIAPFAIEF